MVRNALDVNTPIFVVPVVLNALCKTSNETATNSLAPIDSDRMDFVKRKILLHVVLKCVTVKYLTISTLYKYKFVRFIFQLIVQICACRHFRKR